ncbi:thiamine pyrophosphate-binding protein [Labrys wisconsinensis]|uniref:3D-(3,5/4)-trihydroxycyclohexane-1,2-dione acylhydrolase (Decyclizing) n=1 Tax=Labrys wisconsinensis TaxID=425677 RepID=A0ABU0J7Q2_9HYPH|nr:thiamine pyrophosphate-dependent enzyme [Labrys wisconsinensis]MDQ0469546.1 3D-(3,5/4)-trihydroxycyclohexane-1,2-dione acylhydrolase (decyclizing) [Labrys wisconsinensis]
MQAREEEVRARARAIAAAGGLSAALAAGTVPGRVDVSVSEGVVLGLMRQGVTKVFGILGHGNTDVGEVLRIYAGEGALRFLQCRNEVAMAHAATALRWIYGETPAVVTSIGPGALQAFAGSLAAASNGIGVYHLYGDETTHGEGPNMQQVPGTRQGQFGRLTDVMGPSFTLHTPEALREAMRRGNDAVHRPHVAGPFYLCLPINVQPRRIEGLRLDALPERLAPPATAPSEAAPYRAASALALGHGRIVIKAGGGASSAPDAVRRLAERLGAAVVLSPKSTGVLPDAHPLNMHVGGSKGSISGNHAMEEASLLIAIGTRAVCQADCSGTGYPRAEAVININGDLAAAAHYNHTLMLPGDIGAVIERWLAELGPARPADAARTAAWREACAERKAAWRAFKAERCGAVTLPDAAWGRPVLTQPSAVAALARFADARGAIKIFDAGDVQANGFQIVEDDRPGRTITEAGASYMGFAASALLAAAAADRPAYMIAFSGDGSFMMNPQILVDAVLHGVRGMLVVFDNRRMGAISSLQHAQYGPDFATGDDVAVDYVALAAAVRGVKAVFGGWTPEAFEAALREAYAHDGLSVVHVPVYWGDDPLGGMGAYGRWNVGPWCAEVERLYADQTL